jgi:hypothetical protein
MTNEQAAKTTTPAGKKDLLTVDDKNVETVRRCRQLALVAENSSDIVLAFNVPLHNAWRFDEST